MQTIEFGRQILEEKKREEASKRGESSSTMNAAAALLDSGSKKQRKKYEVRSPNIRRHSYSRIRVMCTQANDSCSDGIREAQGTTGEGED